MIENNCNQAPPFTPDQGYPQACCGRQRGKAVFEDILHRLARKQKHIQVLLDMLPSNPTPEQDEALWQIAVEMER